MIKKIDTVIHKLYIPEVRGWEYTMTYGDWASEKLEITNGMLMTWEPNRLQNTIDRWHDRQVAYLNRDKYNDKG